MRDLLDWAVQLAIAEENARLAAEQLARGVQVKVVQTPAPAYTTRVEKKKDVEIPVTLIDETGQGKLKELIIKSSFNGYRLIVSVDGRVLYSDDYEWFQDISQEVDEIAAFESNGTYVLHLSDIAFSNRIRVRVEPTLMTLTVRTLDEVFWKLEIAEI